MGFTSGIQREVFGPRIDIKDRSIVVRQENFRPRLRLHERLDWIRAFVRFGSSWRGCVDHVVISTTADAHQERIPLDSTRYVTSSRMIDVVPLVSSGHIE